MQTQCNRKGRNSYTTNLNPTSIGLRLSSQRNGSQEGSHPCTSGVLFVCSTYSVTFEILILFANPILYFQGVCTFWRNAYARLLNDRFLRSLVALRTILRKMHDHLTLIGTGTGWYCRSINVVQPTRVHSCTPICETDGVKTGVQSSALLVRRFYLLGYFSQVTEVAKIPNPNPNPSG